MESPPANSIPAIFEDGVFKPVGPVSLPEHTEVMISVPAGAASEGQSAAIAAQREAMRLMLEDVNALPQHRNDDGWSVANNADEILYGGPDGPA